MGLYEKQSGKKLDNYHDAAIQLAEIHMNEYVEQQSIYGGRQEFVADGVVVLGMTRYAVKLS